MHYMHVIARLTQYLDYTRYYVVTLYTVILLSII